MIDAIFGVDEIVDDNKYEIVMDFDFPSWVLEKNEPFQLFKKSSKYQLNYDIKKVQYMRNEIKSIYGQNKGYTSSDRAFGRYLMQYIKRILISEPNQTKQLLKLKQLTTTKPTTTRNMTRSISSQHKRSPKKLSVFGTDTVSGIDSI